MRYGVSNSLEGWVKPEIMTTGVPVAQAKGFADALKAKGVDVVTRFFPNSGHELPVGEVMRSAVEFLDKRLEN